MDLFDLLAISRRIWPTVTSLIVIAAIAFSPQAMTAAVWREAQLRATEIRGLFEQALERALDPTEPKQRSLDRAIELSPGEK